MMSTALIVFSVFVLYGFAKGGIVEAEGGKGFAAYESKTLQVIVGFRRIRQIQRRRSTLRDSGGKATGKEEAGQEQGGAKNLFHECSIIWRGECRNFIKLKVVISLPDFD